MPFNGSGLFTRLYSWVADAASSIPIRADRMDQEMNGIADGLSNCITKDGQTLITNDLSFNHKRLKDVGDPESETDALNGRSLLWRKIYDETLSAPATEVVIDLDGASEIKIRGDLIPGVTSTCKINWRVSNDGTTYIAANYNSTIFNIEGGGTTNPLGISGAEGLLTYVGFSGADTKNGILLSAEFNAGGASRYPAMSARCDFVSGSNRIELTRSYSKSVAAKATHLKLIASVANGFGAGSKILVEGR